MNSDINLDLNLICGLCLGVIPKWHYNTHLFQHHMITTRMGIRHQMSLRPTSRGPELFSSQHDPSQSSSFSSSDILFNVSNQGYDSDVRDLLKDGKGEEAVDVLTKRSVVPPFTILLFYVVYFSGAGSAWKTSRFCCLVSLLPARVTHFLLQKYNING